MDDEETYERTYTVTVSGTVLIVRNVEANSPEEACKIVEDNWTDMHFEAEYGDYGGYEAEEE